MVELLTAVQIGLLTTAVIGATEMVRRSFKKDWEAVVIIAVAALLGGLGACLFVGFTAVVFFYGMAVGLGASGIITGLQKFSSGTHAVPTTLASTK